MSTMLRQPTAAERYVPLQASAANGGERAVIGELPRKEYRVMVNLDASKYAALTHAARMLSKSRAGVLHDCFVERALALGLIPTGDLTNGR